MIPRGRLGVGALAMSGDTCRLALAGTTRGPTPTVLAVFAWSDLPVLTVVPAGGDHVPRAAGWALRTLGRGFLGGHVWLVSDDDPAHRDRIVAGECLATVLAVDDAVAGGHRPAGGPGTGLVERLLRDPVRWCGLAHAAGLAGTTAIT